ncbi:PTS sugar transporter subunit IIA [candidate division WOR-3 bacterium]|nr:PTS sugar transporter subunit IIA [candidate division WOR-3 bacterium]
MLKTSIPELIKKAKISLNIKSSNKKNILLQLIKRFELNEHQENLLYKSVLQREEMGSTGIGNGIAIPHTRSMVITDLMISIGMPDEPIEFDAIDDKPVFLIFLIVAPPYASKSEYLILLGKIAETFQEISKADKLFTIQDEDVFKEELCNLFC